MGILQINGNVNIRDLLTLKSGTDAYATPSIAFGSDVLIGYGSTNKNLGIYSSNKIYLRPNNGTLGYSDGIELSTTALVPTKNNTVTLGDSTHKWSNIYATTFTGALSGNASSATTANTATQFTSARTIALTGDVTGSTSSTGGNGWSITTTIGANNHIHDASASWNNRELTVGVGGGGTAAKASIPTTISGFANITSTKFTGALVGNADTATQFASATTVALTGAVTGTSSASTRGWSITTSIARGVSWSNRTITVTIGNGTASGTIPATLTGFTSITSATLIASTTMRIPVKASSYTSTTAGEIWIVA